MTWAGLLAVMVTNDQIDAMPNARCEVRDARCEMQENFNDLHSVRKNQL